MNRRRAIGAAGALVLLAVRPLRAAALPRIPAMDDWLSGRAPRMERVQLTLPPIADNGFAVPMRVSVAGPFAPGPTARAIRLFSETNPVAEMATFDFAMPVERVEVESRIRLAGTQTVVAVAQMSDGALYAAGAEVIVTLAGCMDGT